MTNTMPQIGDTITGRCVTLGTDYTGRVSQIIEPLRYSGDTSLRYRLDFTGAMYSDGTPIRPTVIWNGAAPTT